MAALEERSHEAAERIREATEQTSDFDRAVERIRRLGPAADDLTPPASPQPPKKPARKKSPPDNATG